MGLLTMLRFIISQKMIQLVPEYLNHGCGLLPRWRLIAGSLLGLSPLATLPQPREANHD